MMVHMNMFQVREQPDGASVKGAADTGGSKGNAGKNATNRATGGGGSGAARAGTAVSGKGAVGTSFSGGPGGRWSLA